MIRSATAQWSGGLKTGKGSLTTGSGTLEDVPYNFAKRFEQEPGTNPEELIAAAHAGCFTMQVAADLEKAGFPAQSLDTECKVTLEFVNAAPTVTLSQLSIRGKATGIDEKAFRSIVDNAKKNCVISRLLNVQMTLDVQFES